MKKSFTLVVFLLCFLGYCQKDTSSDSLQQWISKYHTISTLTYSPDTNFVLARKIYAGNNDTAVVLDAHRSHRSIATILKMPNNIFLKNSSLVSSGNGTVQFSNLYNSRTVKYDNVKLSEVLYDVNQYIILDRNGILSLYGPQSQLLQKLPNTTMFASDKNSLLFAVTKEEKGYKIVNVGSRKITTLYYTQLDIKQMMLSPSGKNLTLVLSDANRKLKMVFLETESGKHTIPSQIPPSKADFIEVNEIQNGKAYLITLANRNRKPADKFIDIWYGSDNNLGSKQAGTTQYIYYLWKPKEEQAFKLPESYPIYSIIDSDRYVIAFNPLEEFKNLTLHPLLNVQLYDVSTGSFTEIFHQVAKDLVHSSNGRFIMAFEPKTKKWNIYDIASSRITLIEKAGLQNPTFSSDFTNVFFESRNDIWIYDIKKRRLSPIGISPATEGTIVNAIRKTTNAVYGIKMSMAPLGAPLLIKLQDRASNSTAYHTYLAGRTKIAVRWTKNRIKEIKYDTHLKNFLTLEENFNMAPKILSAKFGATKKNELLAVKDKTAQTLKQDVVEFKNSIGTPLKGILYYPVDYSPSKSYPMVVYIYQIKSNLSNMYAMPANEPTGVNRRTLLEHGYFVYEPDIIFDARGTGLAALDCVHSALNAISLNKAIDKNKIGLTGHSMGGYETNFIATHSNRFAAFISGAGKSDIVSSYFSYDYHEQKPNLTRFEVGQYDFRKPFTADKELYIWNSPIHYVENVKAPVLLWTGVKDDIVPPQQTMEFFMGLKRNDLPVIALFYQQKEHDLGWNTTESKDMSRRALDWWNYFLKNKMETPWIRTELKARQSLNLK